MFKDIKHLGSNGDWELELGHICYVGSFDRDEGYVWSTMKVDGWKTQSELINMVNPSKSFKINYA